MSTTAQYKLHVNPSTIVRRAFFWGPYSSVDIVVKFSSGTKSTLMIRAMFLEMYDCHIKMKIYFALNSSKSKIEGLVGFHPEHTHETLRLGIELTLFELDCKSFRYIHPKLKLKK